MHIAWPSAQAHPGGKKLICPAASAGVIMIVPAAAAGNSLMEAPVDNGVLMESVSSVHLSSVHLQCPSATSSVHLTVY